ncbi:MAG: metallo-mystery pair system four-Cys motif protein [Candidatus Thiothrix singaporensis]|uniref:Metallo-mystery pair system four-Cys motif protein n=1 Tax=Candidatus Thiothrix singaporensis TaxID=2799669 RepID=A0A7L6AVF4_9GAMM|nr:MAG: metallo-mystery pair system four-Cys motif protein [Candidatus Thiothrix singaporensis]
MKQTLSLTTGLAVAGALFLTACGGGSSNDSSSNTSNSSNSSGGNTTATATTTSLTIPFAAKAGTTDINCGATLTGLGTSGDSGKISDFAFYIHGITLKTSDGKSVAVTLDDNSFQDPQYGVALLDFQDKTDSCAGAAKTTNKEVKLKATVDPATITGIAFTVGVPEDANHHNASIARAPYNRAGLFWSWQSGHKFMRRDVNPTLLVTKPDATTTNTFNLHLGSTGCTGDATTGQVVACTSPNRPTVNLDGVKVTGSTTSTVVLDYAKVIAGTNINIDTGGAVGCMSAQDDKDCPAIFGNLGLPHNLNSTTGTQQAFSIQ